MPFSEPLADGPVIQRATERALKAGATLDKVLTSSRRCVPRSTCRWCCSPMSIPWPAWVRALRGARGAARASTACSRSTCPIEEADEFRGLLDKAGLDTIFLLSPTTTPERLARAAALGRGFLYGISRLGVTGARDQVAASASELAARVRGATTLPLALGFGVSRPDHVQDIGRIADAAVVGSALVQVIADAGRQRVARAGRRGLRAMARRPRSRADAACGG